MYWKSATAQNWNSTANWSTVSGSGGPSATAIPTALDTVIFDGNGGTTGNCTINVAASFAKIIVTSGYSGTIIQSAAFTIGDSAIFGGGTFTGGASSITLKHFSLSGTAFASTTGTMSISGDCTYSAGTFNAGTGTVLFNGSSATNTISGSFTGTNKFYNLTFNSSGAAWSIANATDVGNNFTITAGTVTAPSSTLQVVRNWTNSGTFINNSGTVVFNGTLSQTIGGTAATSFNNFTNSNSAATVSVNTNINVAGTLNMNGVATVLSPAATVVLNSGGAGGTISGTGTLKVSRITATADYVNQYKFTTHTLTGMTVDYSGTAAQTIDSNVGNYGALKTSGSGIKTLQGPVVVNNNITIGASTTLYVGTGNYQITVGGSWANSGSFSAQTGTVLFNSTAIGKTLSGSMTAANKFNNLTFNGSGGAWSFAANAVDIGGNFAITTGTVTASSSTMQVSGNWSNNGAFINNNGTVVMNSTAIGKTLSGTMVTASKFYNLTFNGSGGAWSFGANAVDIGNNFAITTGTVTATSTTMQVGGNWSNSGRFASNGGTVIMNATSTGKTISGFMTGLNNRFKNLTFSGVGGGWAFSDSAEVNGTFTISAGTVRAPATKLLVATNWAITGGVFTHNGGTVNMIEGGSKTLSGTLTGGNAFNNLTFNGSTGNWSFGSSPVDVAGNFTMLTGTVTATSATAQVGGNWIHSVSATYVHNSGTVILNGTAAQAIAGPGTTTFYNLTNSNTSAAVSVNVNTNISNLLNINGATAILTPSLTAVFNNSGAAGTISGTGTIQVTRTAATADYQSQYKFTTNTLSNLTVDYAGAGAQTVSATVLPLSIYGALKTSGSGVKTLGGGVTSKNDITIGASTTLDLSSGNYQLIAGGSWANNGSFAAQAGTVEFYAVSGGKTISGAMTGANKFYNLNFNGTSGGAWTFGANPADIGGDITLIKGTVTAPSTILQVAGNWKDSSTFAHNNGTVILNGTTAQAIGGTASTSFNNLTNSNTTATVSINSDINVSGTLNMNGAATVLAPAASVVINSGSAAGTISGDGTIQVTRTAATADYISQYKFSTNTLTGLTVDYAGAGAQSINGTAGNYGTLKTSTSGTKTLAGAIIVNNDITIGTGTTLDASVSNYQITAGGNWTNNGTFTAQTGTVVMSSTATGKALTGAMTGSNEFYNLTFNGSGGAWTFGASSADIGNDLTITAGTVTAPSATLQVAGSWSNSGTFTNNSGTVVMNSTTTGKTLTGSMTGGNKFNNLTFNGSGGAWSFGSSSADVGNDFTITAGTVTAPSTTLQIAGNWNNSGAFTHNGGSVVMISTAAGKALAGSMTGSNKFNNITFNGSGGTWTFGTNATDVANDFTITAGTLTAPSSTLQVGGNWSNSGTFTNNGGTLVMNSTAAGKSLTGAMTGSNKFNNLTFNGSGGTWSFGGNAADVGNDFTITDGTVTAPSLILQVGGSWSNSRAFTHNGGTVVMNSTATGKTLTGNMTGSNKFNALTFNGSGGEWSFGANAADIGSDLIITTGTITSPTTTLNVDGNYNQAGGTYTAGAGGTLNITGDYISSAGSFLAGSSTINLAGNWSNTGIFSAGSGNVVMTSTTAGKSLAGAMTGSNKFNNLTFDGIGGGWSFGGSSVDVGSDFVINAGTVTAPSAILQVAGNWSNSGTYINNGGSVIMNSTATGKTLTGSMTGTNGFNALTFNGSGGGWSFGSNAVDVNSNLTVTDGTVTSPTNTVNVTGNYNQAGGTYTAGTGGTLNITGDFSTSGGTFAAGNSTINLTGNWSNAGSFSAGTGTLVMNSTTTGKTLTGAMTGSNKFNNLTFNGSGGAWSFGSTPADIGSNFTLTTGAVTVPSTTLQIGGDLLSTGGTFSNNSGTVVLNGTGAQQIGSSGGPSLTFNNLSWTISGTKTLSTGVSVTGTLTPSGTAVLASGGLLTIKSSPTQTANVAAGSVSGGYITGDVTMERYIAAGTNRAWRMLAVPTTGSQTIQAAWQEGATSGGSNPVPGYGTYITCNPDHSISNGFDALNPSYTTPSIEQYDVANQSWTSNPVPNTNTQALSSQPGYFLFVRGDRTCTPANSTITSTTLRSTGTLKTGDQTAINVLAGKFALIGNPYASAIDFSTIADITDRTDLNNKFWVWDPQLNTVGGYQLFDFSASWMPVPGGGSYGSGANTILQSGQAFFVQSSGSAGTLTLREAHKVSGSNNHGFKTTSDDQLMKISLNLLNDDGTTILADGVLAIFSATGSADVNGQDAVKPKNMNESFSILRANKSLMLEKRPPVSVKDTLHLQIQKMRVRKYQFLFKPDNFSNAMSTAFLYDSYKNTYTPVSLSSESNYTFSVNADSASSIINRFMVVFEDSIVVTPDAQNGITLYPNPVKNGLINLKFIGQKTGLYTIRIVDATGSTIISKQLQHLVLSNTYSLTTPGNLPRGIYLMEIIKPDGEKIIIKVNVD